MARTALYRFFDSDDVLLYVGITDSTETRWRAHATQKDWWPHVARKTIEWHDERADAEAAERRAIRDERPLHNIRGIPGRRKHVLASRGDRQITPWLAYVQRVSNDASEVAIANRTGIGQTTINRWAASMPKVGNVRAFALAYGRPIVEAFIAAGFITTEDTQVRPRALADVSDDALLAEVRRRMKR